MDRTGTVLFPVLRARSLAVAWAERAHPEHEVALESVAIAQHDDFGPKIAAFLAHNPIVARSLESMLAQLAITAGVDWRDTPLVLHPLSRRGHSIGRWLPTFLLIEGPLGRLLRGPNSPLSDLLRVEYRSFPLLCSARDAFNSNLFRLVRNSFAHWSFMWNEDETITLVDWRTGRVDETLSVLECEAMHFLGISVVRALDEHVIRRSTRVGG